MSSAIDYTIDPATGATQCRLPPAEPAQPLRDRHQRDRAVRPEAHLHGLRGARREAADHLHHWRASARLLCRDDAPCRATSSALVATFRGEPAPVVKSLTNDILVPADAEMTLEGYLDERGYVEPRRPVTANTWAITARSIMDPVFHCTAITMRRDVLHHTLLHGSAFVLDQTDSADHLGACAPRPRR